MLENSCKLLSHPAPTAPNCRTKVAGLTLGHRNAELWNEVFFFHFRGGKVTSDGDIQDNLAALEVKLFDKNAIYFYNFR